MRVFGRDPCRHSGSLVQYPYLLRVGVLTTLVIICKFNLLCPWPIGGSRDPEVTQEEAEQLAQQQGWPFFATSSKSGVNVDDPLFGLLDMLLDEVLRR